MEVSEDKMEWMQNGILTLDSFEFLIGFALNIFYFFEKNGIEIFETNETNMMERVSE